MLVFMRLLANRHPPKAAERASQAAAFLFFRAAHETGGDVSDLRERVKRIVIDRLGIDASRVTDKAHFIDDLGSDSLQAIDIVMAIEEEFGCDIPDAVAEKLFTIDDAVRFIEARG